MATYGTLADIRTELRVRLGLPDRGTSGDTRLNLAVNMALRQLWSEMPKALLAEEMRFLLEKPVSLSLVQTVAADKLAFYLSSGNSVTLATDGTLRGRTIEVLHSGTYYYRKIRSVSETGSGGNYYVIIDQPVPFTATGVDAITGRILTTEYPYPANVQQVLDVIRDPDSNPHPMAESVWAGELHNYRATIGFRTSGLPEYYTRGDFYQLESPNYTPEVSKYADLSLIHI